MICESSKPIFIKGFKVGAKWQFNKALEWLKFNLQDYAGEDSCRNSVPFDKYVFKDFRIAMEG